MVFSEPVCEKLCLSDDIETPVVAEMSRPLGTEHKVARGSAAGSWPEPAAPDPTPRRTRALSNLTPHALDDAFSHHPPPNTGAGQALGRERDRFPHRISYRPLTCLCAILKRLEPRAGSTQRRGASRNEAQGLQDILR